MPVLANPKHERFAQELAKGSSASSAMSAADLCFNVPKKISGFYVYALVDPCADTVFYIGKGKGRRCFDHYRDWQNGCSINPVKTARIDQIAAVGARPKPIIIADGLSEDDALRLEVYMIRGIGRDRLTNYHPGQLPEVDRVALDAAHTLTRIRPYCHIIHLGLTSGNESVPMYWGVIAGFQELSGKRLRIPPEAHFAQWRESLKRPRDAA